MAAEVVRLARAKVNLALHVTGRRADGYHLLDSLVVFAETGDVLSGGRAPDLRLEVGGPMGQGLTAGPENLVLRAAALFGRGAALRLDKRLPVASGIGGGSADAAAALQVMAALHGVALPAPEAVLALGADVPVCMAGVSCRMQGIGEVLSPVTLPPAWLVLVNPGVGVSTPEVFRALARRDNPALPPMPRLADARALAAWLGATRNDLQAPAMALCPEVGQVLGALAATEGCLLARMSGSGATCFGLYADEAEAWAAARALTRPGWWVQAAAMAGGQAGGPAD